METKETALKGGMVKYVIFLLFYILFNLILIRFVHNSYYQFAVYTVLGITGVILSRNTVKEGCAMWKAHPVKNILIVLGGIVLNYLLDNISVIPYALLYAEQAGNLNDNNIAAASQAVNLILFAIISGILGPLTEETVFREILTRQASRFVPKAVAVIVSSLLFGVIHMHAITLCEFLSILPHISFGALMAILYLKTKNITLVYILHILNNLPVVLILLL